MIRKTIKKLFSKIYTLLPVKEDCIVFWDGVAINGFGDNIRPIYEELKKRYPKYEYIFIVSNKHIKKRFPIEEKVVISRKAERYLSTCKIYVTNMFGLKFNRRSEQIWISTGHGTPIKTIGFLDKGFKITEEEKREIERQEQDFNVNIVQNEFSKEYFIKSYRINCSIKDTDLKRFYVFGAPRNDILFRDNTDKIKDIKQRLNIALSKKVLLYVPTYRGGYGTLRAEAPLEFERLKSKFGKEYVFLIRAHYFLGGFNDEIRNTNDDFIIDVSKYPDISELYLVADILVTDYSSSAVDFVITKKPLIFYCYDYDEYEKTRGFNVDFKSEMPGRIVYSQRELIEAIENIKQDSIKFKEKREIFYQKYCSYEDGNAARRVVDLITDIIAKGENHV